MNGCQEPGVGWHWVQKGHGGTFGDDRNSLYYDSGDSYKTEYISQNSWNYILKMGDFYCI